MTKMTRQDRDYEKLKNRVDQLARENGKLREQIKKMESDKTESIPTRTHHRIMDGLIDNHKKDMDRLRSSMSARIEDQDRLRETIEDLRMERIRTLNTLNDYRERLGEVKPAKTVKKYDGIRQLDLDD